MKRSLVLMTVAAVAGALAVVGTATAASAAGQPATTLTTPWTSQVSKTSPLPEYPRPQLTRTEWQSLNGPWQFAGSTQTDTPPTGQNLAESVLVPYPIESTLSGLRRHQDNMWYRRTFTVPSSWSGRHVQLNFGAVNWKAAVWVNGTRIGGHTGAYDPFSFDITSALAAGTNEVIVGVWSPISADRPRGKQTTDLGDIWYTAASGIWQSVWLEPTADAHATRLDTTPDVVGGALDLVVQASASSTVHAEVLSGGQVVGSADGSTGAHVRVPIPNARLWSPDDPFLYDLKVTLGSGDAVGGYFGMRSVGKALVGGVLRPVLNGRFVFQLGTLDQGYWPDGIYTAPTDDALKYDLQQQKNLGFNTVRKHIKVEPARWFYWADKLGLMVWQDMPSIFDSSSAFAKSNFESELKRMIDNLRGITSIVQWQPFNEGWGEYDETRITALVKSWDPTRLVDGNSGSSCCGRDPGNGDVIDDHRYESTIVTNTPTASRTAALGEFGGLTYAVSGHVFDPNRGVFGYEKVPDLATLNKRYVEVFDTLQWLIYERGLSAAIYTQPTDVENELNGLMTYDRQVMKVDPTQIRAANLALINTASAYQTGDLVSLAVTTSPYTDRYLRHSSGLGSTSVISRGSDSTSRQDATYWLRPGLASSACYSFESRNYPGQYLRPANSRIRIDPNDSSSQFAADATFCPRAGHTGNGISLESYNYPGRFLRHASDAVYIATNGGSNSWDSTYSWADDTTWQLAQPLWRSGANLPAGSAISLQVTTANYTDRYLRHADSLGYTAVVTASSDATLKADATWYVVPGLADASCYSFKSRNYDGQYLRHSMFRIRKDADDGTVFDRDATFCAQPGLAGRADVTLESYNLAAHSIRHYSGEVWIATPGGPKPYDNAGSFNADVTWHVAAPWTP